MDGEVLVLTCLEDTTADEVIGRLSERGARVARLDPGRDFPDEVALAARYGDHLAWGTLSTRSREVDLSRVRAVYYRRPTPYLHGRAAPEVVRFSAAHEARAFAAQHGPTIYKPLRMTPIGGPDGRQATIWATSIDPDHLDERVNGTAHLFQARVEKVADVRVTVVGRRVFCVRIDSGLLDWRRDYERLQYTVVDPPPDIADACLTYLKNLDLVFGAFDFVLTAEGRWVFLEANPNGQWAWLQDVTGLPIASAIADLLLEGP